MEVIAVDERAAERLGEQPPDGRLAGARDAHHDNGDPAHLNLRPAWRLFGEERVDAMPRFLGLPCVGQI